MQLQLTFVEVYCGNTDRGNGGVAAKRILAYSNGNLCLDSFPRSSERGANVTDVYSADDGSCNLLVRYTRSMAVHDRCWRLILCPLRYTWVSNSNSALAFARAIEGRRSHMPVAPASWTRV